MDFIYLFKLLFKNIDSFNISIITGLLTGWFVVLLDSKFKLIRDRRNGFYEDRYRRFQNIRRLSLMISRLVEVFRITKNEDIRTLVLTDFKRDMDLEFELTQPYRNFIDLYLTDNMKEIITREIESISRVKRLVSVNNINELDLVELLEEKSRLWKIAYDIRKENRKETNFEVAKLILKDKNILFIAILALLTLLIG